MPDIEEPAKDTNAAIWKSDIGVTFWKESEADREHRRAAPTPAARSPWRDVGCPLRWVSGQADREGDRRRALRDPGRIQLRRPSGRGNAGRYQARAPSAAQSLSDPVR